MNDCSLLLKNLDRLEALDKTGLFGTDPEIAFSRLNKLATKFLNAPISIFSLIGKDKQFFKSAQGFEITKENNTVPIDVSVCQYSLQGKPLAIEDTLGHPLFSENPAVKALNIVGYLGVPVVTKDGHAIGAVCVIDHKKRKWSQEEVSILEDLTSSFLSEIELRQSLRSAEKESYMREEFVSIASHELKSPLSAMKLQVQLAHKRVSSEKMTKDQNLNFLNTVESQIGRLTRMIDDMSDASRLSDGKYSMHKETIDITDLIGSVVGNFSGVLSKSQSTVTLNLEPKIHCHCDAMRIEQILINLLTNSSKYAPGSEIQISLTKESQLVRIDVIDNGHGISPEAQKTIFSKYAREKNDTTVKGLGLGLYISRQIAEEHGGSLDLIPSSKGAHFQLSLPV